MNGPEWATAALEKSAQVWCKETTSDIVMDPILAAAVAQVMLEFCQEHQGEFLKQYVRDAMRTETKDYEAIARRMNGCDMDPAIATINDVVMMRVFHFAIGMVTEIGEFFDTIKKHVWYGQSLDKRNLVEELGDLSWYMAGLVDALGLDWSAIMDNNIAKLRKRFPDKFTEHDAEHRDLHAEAAALAFREKDCTAPECPVCESDVSELDLVVEHIRANAGDLIGGDPEHLIRAMYDVAMNQTIEQDAFAILREENRKLRFIFQMEPGDRVNKLVEENAQLRGLVELAADDENWVEGIFIKPGTARTEDVSTLFLRDLTTKVLEGMSVEEATRQLEQEREDDA